MTSKIAVLFIHGIQIADTAVADQPKRILGNRFGESSDDPGALVMETALWGKELHVRQDDLLKRCLGESAERFSQRMTGLVTKGNKALGDQGFLGFPPVGEFSNFLELGARTVSARPTMNGLRYPGLRWFLVHFAGDAIAYQQMGGDDGLYKSIHQQLANVLQRLAAPESAGPEAPLCVIAHSLGSVIASNYFYDLQKAKGEKGPVGDNGTALLEGKTPLERGDTLASFYTMGSPLALWASSYTDSDGALGKPITVPAPQLREKIGQEKAESLGLGWVNLIDPDDIAAYPLRPLGGEYRQVTDTFVSTGSILTDPNPLSHITYWYDEEVMDTIAKSLAKVVSTL